MGRDERHAEIARLEHLRDRALADAPANRLIGRGIALVVIAFSVLLLVTFGLTPPADGPLAFVIVGATFVVSAWVLWRGTIGEPRGLDAWETSDRHPNEEGSARDIQAKIDRLREDAGPWG